jgi:hypothetical protein
MIASPVLGQRWLLVLLISTFGMTAWQARPATEVALTEAAPAAQPDVAPVTYRYVPLLGTPLTLAVEDARGELEDPPRDPSDPVRTCLPFLAPLLAHPNWQIRIVRHLQLSNEQLALVQRLDRLSCVMWKDVPASYLRSHWLTIGIDFISQDRGIDGAQVPLQSDLGQALAPVLDQLVAEYPEPRGAVVGSMDLRLATTQRGAIYRVRIAGERLTVSQGRRLLVEEQVGSETMIDLVDLALERRAVVDPDLKGTLLMNGWSVPVAVSRRAPGPFEQIERAVERAIERAQEAE